MTIAGTGSGFGAAEAYRILRGLLPDAAAALYGPDAQLIWADGHWAPDDTAAAAHLLLAGASREKHTVQVLADGRVLRVIPVLAAPPAEAEAFYTVVCGRGSEEGVGDAIAALVAGITAYRRLEAELDGMAGELADRYEELNLVYSTSNQTHCFPEGEAALDNLVKICRDHLDAALVALVLPAQGLSFEGHDSRSPVQRVPEFLRAIAGRFFEDFASAACTLVLNEDMGVYAVQLKPFGAMKLAAAPVLDSRGAVCGALLMVNPPDAADFTNSDKNLLLSIAERAAKIVHTSYDALTGLLLIGEFERRLEAAHRHSRQNGSHHCVVVIDLDQLDVVNETLGHQAGDELLRVVGRHLDCYRGPDRVTARLGSDDFGLLLENCTLENARQFGEELRLSLSQLNFAYNSHPIEIAASIGIAGMDERSDNAAVVLHAAQLASTAAREKGRNSVHVCQDGSTSIIQHAEQMRWVARIQNALRENSFCLYGQLIRRLDGKDEPHIEVLLRLLDEEGGIQSPATFLPAAERYFLMPSVDRWVIKQTLAELARSTANDGLVCSINLSGQSMSDESFVEFILRELAQSGINGARICFEITETAAITNLNSAKRFMLRLKEEGCRFSLDDFGTGVSSFTYLKSLPVDFVKLDGSFVKGIVNDPVSESMVIAVTQVGHAMGLKIIAEYVESVEIERRVREIGVDYGQGYAIERPMPLREHLLARYRMCRVATA
jgi:diguanylate cyclase (GGDEF)-like protein